MSARRTTRALLMGMATLAAVAAIVPGAGRAQQPRSVPGVLAGAWVHDGELARAIRTVDAAFASTIATLPEILHGFARDRLRNEMPPPRRVAVAVEGSRVRVTIEALRTTVVDGSLGSPARVTGGADGTRITPRLESGWLELRYEGEGSVLRQLYSTEPDGSRMHLDYTVTGPQLRAAVRYRLEYVRASAPAR